MNNASAPTGERGIDRLLNVVDRLRGQDGCPWDREQTLQSLKSLLIEESYELIDAIDADDPDRHRDELGDVLLQVVMQSRIRKEEGAFTFDDVADGLASKLIARHPHVFGDVKVSDSREVLRNWETIKAGEKEGSRSLFEGIPRHLPGLQKAQRIQSRAARVGFDWDRVQDVIGKVREELDEVCEAIGLGVKDAIVEELGDLLFAVVNLARFAGIDAEDAMRKTADKFVRRFRGVESRIHAEGRTLEDCTLEEMDAHWEAVKRDGG